MNKFGYVVLMLMIACIAPLDAWAKKPEQVSIKLNPNLQSVTVDMRTKQVRGNSATVNVNRTQPGRGCTKVRYVRIARGTNYKSVDELGLQKIGPKNKGLCNFTTNIRVKPFDDSELIAQCRTPGGRKTVLTKKGTVTFWRTRPEYIGKRWVPDGTYRTECKDVRYCYYKRGDTCVEHRTRRECEKVANGEWKNCSEICVGKTIKNKKGKQLASRQVTFAARVNCKAAIASAPVHLPSACSIQGWWKFSSSNPSMNGEWFFRQTSSSANQRNYSSKGPSPSTYIGMAPKPGKYSGYATAKADKTFSLRVGNTTCSGRIDTSCSRIDGRCFVRSPGQRSRGYSFNLIKSSGPSRISAKSSPVGRPIGTTSPAGTKKSPSLPGSTFRPGPDIPQPGVPRW